MKGLNNFKSHTYSSNYISTLSCWQRQSYEYQRSSYSFQLFNILELSSGPTTTWKSRVAAVNYRNNSRKRKQRNLPTRNQPRDGSSEKEESEEEEEEEETRGQSSGDVYHRDRTVENRYLDRGKKARQQLGLHVAARAICHPALPICDWYLLSWCRGRGLLWPDAG